MAPSSTKGYRELTEKQKREILGACLAMRVNGDLPRGSFAKIARNMSVGAKSVARLWLAAKTTRAVGKVTSPDCRMKKAAPRDHRKIYDREVMMEETLAIPHWKRQTVRNLAHELKMPKSTLHDIMKKEGKEVMSQKTSRLKVNLNEEQMLQRIMYCLSMTRWRRTRSRQKCFYHNQLDTIHIDEKWFYMTKVNNRYILVVGEEPPKRTVANKHSIRKVMFLCAQARPRDLADGSHWDGKIGIWPIGDWEPAKKSSKNRPAGTLEWKNHSVDGDKYFELMTELVVPAIVEKWPQSWTGEKIKIQHDGARAHFKHDHKPWLDYLKDMDEHLPWKIELYHQPPNSPDLNILDLGFFAALQSTCLGAPVNERELIELVQQKYEAYPAKKINFVWLSHMQIMNCILQRRGDNDYKLPHMNKEKLWRMRQLPEVIEVDREARIACRGPQVPAIAADGAAATAVDGSPLVMEL